MHCCRNPWHLRRGGLAILSLTLAEIKELLAYGQDLGLQQLQTEGLVAVYGHRAVLQVGQPSPLPDEDEVTSITKHYAAIGKQHSKR